MARPGATDGITEASILMQDHIGSPLGGEDLHVDGVVSEKPPSDDVYGMTDFDKKLFGLQPHECHISIRDGSCEEWKKVDPGRFRQIQQKYQGQARVLKDAEGNLARPHLPGLSDQVLVAVPKALYDHLEEEHAQATREQMAESDPNHGHRDHFNPKRREDIEAAAEESHFLLEQISAENGIPSRLSQGIVGNTSGMSLDEALARIPREIREEEARRYRQGARYAGLTDEEFGQAMAGATKNSKSYGVGKGLGNDNPNSALNQARNARARDTAQTRR